MYNACTTVSVDVIVALRACCATCMFDFSVFIKMLHTVTVVRFAKPRHGEKRSEQPVRMDPKGIAAGSKMAHSCVGTIGPRSRQLATACRALGLGPQRECSGIVLGNSYRPLLNVGFAVWR